GFVVGISFVKNDELNRQALADFFKRASEVYNQAITAERMQATITAMQAPDFDTTGYEPEWDMRDQDTQRLFARQLFSYLSRSHQPQDANIPAHYINWLLDRVFVEMQRPESDGGAGDRLFANELMGYIDTIFGLPDAFAARPIYERAINEGIGLGEILKKLVDSNLFVYHGHFTRFASDASVAKAVKALDEHAEEDLLTAESTEREMAKAQIAYAIAADICEGYQARPGDAAGFRAKLNSADQELSKSLALGYLEALSSHEPQLVENAENRAFLSFAPGGSSWSDKLGSGALNRILLDDSAEAVSAPLRFANERWQRPAPASAIAQMRHDVDEGGKPLGKVVLRFISNTDSKRQTTEETIEGIGGDVNQLYCVRSGSDRVFSNTESDPLARIKFALFFTGIIGASIDRVPGITEEEKARARRDPMFLAQLYYKRARNLALADIRTFMEGNGLEITCDNHLAPVAAELSSQASVTVSLLESLYNLTSRGHVVSNKRSLTILASFLEGDLGFPTDILAPASVLEGIENRLCRIEADAGGKNHLFEYPERLHRHEFAQGALGQDAQKKLEAEAAKEIDRRTFIFRPGISRSQNLTQDPRRMAFLLRKDDGWRALENGRILHSEIVQALHQADMEALSVLMRRLSAEGQKLDPNSSPDELELLFDSLRNSAPGRPEPLIIDGYSMGQGESAVLIATDHGLEEVTYRRERMSRLEAELHRIIDSDPTFENGGLAFTNISRSGPIAKVLDIHPFEEISAHDTPQAMITDAAEKAVGQFIQAIEEKKRAGMPYVVVNFSTDSSQTPFLEAFVAMLKVADDHYIQVHGSGTEEHYYSSRLRGVSFTEYESLPFKSPVATK
ncbi:MAG: hypothetical protein HQ558_02815, partial [Candidatus Omnitrophica bacterium]|nr:hypothetical protein [Candidatus Omnitrophota bacterium]